MISSGIKQAKLKDCIIVTLTQIFGNISIKRTKATDIDSANGDYELIPSFESRIYEHLTLKKTTLSWQREHGGWF